MPTATETLRTIFKNIADAIRRKDGTTESTDKIEPSDFSSRIDAISTGIDTSDADATSDDLASDKIAYSSTGKIIGSITTVEKGEKVGAPIPVDLENCINGYIDEYTEITAGSNIIRYYKVFSAALKKQYLLREGSKVEVVLLGSLFGNAKPEDVAEGKSFTSSSGLYEFGTASPLDTSDATAAPSDIASGKTAYVNGEKITGLLSVITGTYYGGAVTPTVSGGRLELSSVLASDELLRSGSAILLNTQMSNLGNASASDVAPGKTFTSSAGLKVTGSMPTAGSPTGGTLGTTGSPSWSSSNPNVGSGVVSISGVTQSEGYTEGLTNGGWNISVPSGRLLKGRTITPTTSLQNVGPAEAILYGKIDVAGDANLVASNIKKGVSIFGVAGNVVEGDDTSDATAVAADIASGKTAYVNGSKISGSATSTASGSSTSLTSSSPEIASSYFQLPYTFTSDRHFYNGSTINLRCLTSKLGNATAADVLAGKTFTSTNGLLLTGTKADVVIGELTPSSSLYIDVPVQNASNKARLVLYLLPGLNYVSTDGKRLWTIIEISIQSNYGIVMFANSNQTLYALESSNFSFNPSTTASASNRVNINTSRVRIYRSDANDIFKDNTYFYVLS